MGRRQDLSTKDLDTLLERSIVLGGSLSGLGTKEVERSKNMFVLGLIYWMFDRDIRHTVDFINEKEVLISYEGSCTTCHSSTGSTLSAIQQILKSRVHPTLFVTPQL